jgi:hypothetical protein
MLTLVQLADGTFKLTIDYDDGSVKIHHEWSFQECEPSEAEIVRTLLTVPTGCTS